MLYEVITLHMKVGGYVVSSRIFTESLFAERGVDYISYNFV